MQILQVDWLNINFCTISMVLSEMFLDMGVLGCPGLRGELLLGHIKNSEPVLPLSEYPGCSCGFNLTSETIKAL